MSYTPTVWQDGDIITAEKLNNGISSKILIADVTLNPSNPFEGTCNYSFQDITDFMNNGYVVLFSCQGYLSGPAYFSAQSEVFANVFIKHDGSIMDVLVSYNENELTLSVA